MFDNHLDALGMVFGQTAKRAIDDDYFSPNFDSPHFQINRSLIQYTVIGKQFRIVHKDVSDKFFILIYKQQE